VGGDKTALNRSPWVLKMSPTVGLESGEVGNLEWLHLVFVILEPIWLILLLCRANPFSGSHDKNLWNSLF
jgi:hypothetical protein